MLPPVIKIRQRFETQCLEDPMIATREQLEKVSFSNLVREGEHVRIAVGSRGIRDIQKIIKVLVDILLNLKAHPVFIPAMGSHGGANGENQARVLSEVIGDELSSVPILSTMDVSELGITTSGIPVYFSADALRMEKIVLVNRIKPHTDFSGKIESGLLKMLAIGLGKEKGAEACHIASLRIGMERSIREAANKILSRAPFILGVGIVENAYHRTTRIEALTPKELFEREEELLADARKLMPRLPFHDIDLLIIDEIGKDISGNGMDTTIIGRFGAKDETKPRIGRIYVRDLSSQTHGNATGIGLADVTTLKLIDKIDMETTKINCLTSMSPELGKIPLAFRNDYEALTTLVKMIGDQYHQLKLVWIKNTLDIEECFISTAYCDEIMDRMNIDQLSHEIPLQFDHELNLLPPS